MTGETDRYRTVRLMCLKFGNASVSTLRTLRPVNFICGMFNAENTERRGVRREKSSNCVTTEIRSFLIRLQLGYSFRHVGRLRKDCIFELRSISDEGVERANAANRRIEIEEKFVSDAGGNLSAVPE